MYLEDASEPFYNNSYGNGVLPANQVYAVLVASAGGGVPWHNVNHIYVNKFTTSFNCYKQWNSRRCKINTVQYKNTGGNYANANTTSEYLTNIPIMPDVTAGGKVQKVEYTIREPLVSKFLSNQFAKGDYIKSYQTNGSVSLTLNLDQNYLENYAFKLWDSLGNAGTSGESSTFTVQITAARLNYITFTSLRPLQPKTDILYYEHEIANRTAPSVEISNANQTASINFTTQLLEDLPQYVLILPRLNINTVTGTNNNSASNTDRDILKNLITMQITKLTMKYGTQLDLLGNMGTTENIHKLYEHTVENLGRPEIYEYIRGQKESSHYNPFFGSEGTGGTDFERWASWYGINFAESINKPSGLPFLLLDLNKLNVDGMIPQTNYGAGSGGSKSIQVSIDLLCPPWVANGIAPGNPGGYGYPLECTTYFLRKWKMTVDSISGSVVKNRVQFAGDNILNSLLDYRSDSNYKGQSYEAELYVGGSLFSNIFAKAREYLPSVGKVARAVVNSVNDELKGREDFEKARMWTDRVDKGLKFFGHGPQPKRKSKYI